MMRFSCYNRLLDLAKSQVIPKYSKLLNHVSRMFGNQPTINSRFGDDINLQANQVNHKKNAYGLLIIAYLMITINEAPGGILYTNIYTFCFLIRFPKDAILNL